MAFDGGDESLLFLERYKECGSEIRPTGVEFLFRMPGVVALVG